MKTNQWKHAVVIGGSMAGLLTARVLSDHFEQVTIVERDPVHDRPESRKGQPHTRHLHGLLANGLQIMTRFFPELADALAELDIVVGDMAERMRWYTHGGYRKPFRSGLTGITISRPQLEFIIRSMVLALPNVTLRDNCAVKRLLTTADNGRITGLVLEARGRVTETVQLTADLTVDCSGRGSRTPQWLKELGYDAPPESEVKVNVGYATRLYERDPDDPRGQQWFLITPDAAHENCFGGVFAIENGRWIVTMGGWGGHYCPADEAGFLEFARSLPAPDVYNIISQSSPISEIMSHKFPASLRHHYEKLSRFPAGYLVLGDAIASFNPTYGQGMTSAAMQARLLDEIMRKRPSAHKLAPAFFKKAAKVVDIPWQMAVGEDFRFATTTGPKSAGIDFLNGYIDKVNRASHHDEVIGAAFLKVMNLLAPPASLLHPRLVWRTLRGQERKVSKGVTSARPVTRPVRQS